jgi:hypothetical protein
MHKKFILLFLSVLAVLALHAQSTGTIKGQLIDTVGKQSLKQATVSLLNKTDSSVYTYVLSRDDGSFIFQNISLNAYILSINFQGYDTYRKNVNVTADASSVDLSNIYLHINEHDLANVTVETPPIVVKKDTTEYNANMFKTKPNATAEDLLNKMPGVDVGKDGTIKAQGETVSRVLVNGKRFFGDDPKTATRNLPPDVIDKVQVFDDLSDQSKFTGFDDGNRVKTINIITKKNKGYFGKLVAGIGTDGNYDESVNMHRFDGNEQISVLGQGNDINKQNFTQQDILGGNSGGGGPRGGRGGLTAASSATSPGITTTWAGGANYHNSWGKNNDFAGSYFYNNLHVSTDQESTTNNLLSADSSTITKKSSTALSRTPNHRINFNLEQSLDTNTSFVFRPNITFQTSHPESSSSSVTSETKDGGLINSSITNTNSTNSGFSINGANLQLRHRFAKKYRTISLDINTSASANNGNGYNYALNAFYQAPASFDTLNQYFVDSAHSFTISPTLSYTEPIAKNQILEFRYNFNYNKNYSVNNTYSYDNDAHDYKTLDSLYSNTYKFNSTSSTATISYRLQKEKYNFNIGTGIQFTDYVSNNTVKRDTVAHNYVNFIPTANFNYRFSRTQNLRIFYNGRTGQPSVSNLQPIKTISGLDTTIGNPNLHQQFTNTLRLLYSSFDPVTQRVIFVTLNASNISNDIQSYTLTHLNGTKSTTYVNLNGTYNVNGYFNYGLPLKKPKSNLNLSTNVNYSQSQSIIAVEQSAGNITSQNNFVHSTQIGETVKWTTNMKDKFDMNLSAAGTYNINRYSLNTQQNANYFNEIFIADFTYYTHSGWIFASDFTYTHYGNLSAGYNASVPLVSPSIAKQFLKNKAGELRLTVFDVFKENEIVSRTVSATGQTTDSRTSALGRYAMLTFTFNLKNSSAPKPKTFNFRDGVPPPGGPPPGGAPPGGGGPPPGGGPTF